MSKKTSIVSPLSLHVKLGSIVVHVEEMLSPTGLGFDKVALQTVLDDPEVKSWLARLNKLGLLPVKR